MDCPATGRKLCQKGAYEELEEEISACLKEHRGNSSVASTMLNALLAWPDHPYGFGTLFGSEFGPETKCRVSFVIAETVDLDQNQRYAKERALIQEVKAQLARGRKCQVYRKRFGRGRAATAGKLPVI